MKKIVLIVLLFGLFFCGQKALSDDRFFTIDSRIISGSAVSVNLSEIAESVSFIKLETHPDAPVSRGVRVVAFKDSLIIVNSNSGILVFDSETGKYLYKIKGFNDSGSFGYHADHPAVGFNDDIVMEEVPIWGGNGIQKEGKNHGIWNYKTGEMLNKKLSFSPIKYQKLLFLNDSLLVGCVIDSRKLNGSSSMVDLLSASDGRVVREYGLKERIDIHDEKGMGFTTTNRFIIYDFENYITVCSMGHDTVFGINRATLNLEPRFVVKLGSREGLNNSFQYSNYMSIGAICESSRYLFFNYGTLGTPSRFFYIYYDKKEDKAFYLGESVSNIFENDLTHDMNFFPRNITSGDKAYQVFRAAEVLRLLGPERAAEIGITDMEDNPIIMVVQLKK